ncbi:MAG: YdeI/OmpD-associated family protein [archaeon]|jgi:uncharacterized protein YdeI (YjbR/CyaY-like superfamily)
MLSVSKTLYVSDREKWRAWLEKNHKKEKEIWLVYYNKASGKKRIPYNDAVEEALCFGWIDSTAKGINEESHAQRFTPRRKGSRISELNKERARRMIEAGKMTAVGLEKIKEFLDEEFAIPKEILRELKKDKIVWKNFSEFPEYYKRVRIGYIGPKKDFAARPEEWKKRLKYFIKMTKQNKRFGMMP